MERMLRYEQSKQTRFERVNYLGFDERIVNYPFASWLRSLRRAHERKPAFAVISSVSTHAPYSIANASRCGKECQDAVRKGKTATFPPASSTLLSSSYISPSQRTRTALSFEKYLKALHDTDDWLREIFRIIDHHEYGGDGYTIVVVGDHGEAFHDHKTGGSFHGGAIYDESIKVPCIIFDKRKDSGVHSSSSSYKNSMGTVSSREVDHVFGAWANSDLWTTALSLLGVKVPVQHPELMSPPSLPRSRNILAKEHRLHKRPFGVVGSPLPACDVVVFSALDKENVACILDDPLEGAQLKVMQHGESGRFRKELFNITADPGETQGFLVQMDQLRPSLRLRGSRLTESATSNLPADSSEHSIAACIYKACWYWASFAVKASQHAKRYRKLAAMRIDGSQQTVSDLEQSATWNDGRVQRA